MIEVEPLYELQDQPVEERRWVEVELEEVFSLSEGEDYFLYDVGRVRRDSAGHFYVLDRGDRRIKVFDTNGHYLRSIGGGRGPGPAEFQWPVDFTVAPDGAVWVLDARNRAVTRFSPEGNVVETFRLDDTFPPQRITLTDEGNAIVLALGTNIFKKWNPQGKRLRVFGALVEKQKKATWALGGSIRGGPGGFIFAPNRAGQLLRFDGEGRLRYAVKTMDKIPYPDVAVYSRDGRPRIRPVPNRRFSTWDLAVSNGKIYCYSFPASTPSTRVIDVYRYADGQYRYSFKLPVEFDGVEITKDYLIGLYRGGRVRVWRWMRTTSP